MSPTNLNRLKELAEAATGGAWTVVESGFGNPPSYLVCEDIPGRLRPICAAEHGADASEANAAYIAAASPQVVLGMIARQETAEAALKEIAAIIRKMDDEYQRDEGCDYRAINGYVEDLAGRLAKLEEQGL